MDTSIPVLPSKIGSTVTVKMPPDGETFVFIIIDEIRKFQSNSNGTKVLVLQRLHIDGHKDELRFGYYVIGKKPRNKGKWVWGQYCPIGPASDFDEVFEEAKEKGWFSDI